MKSQNISISIDNYSHPPDNPGDNIISFSQIGKHLELFMNTREVLQD